MALSMIFLFVVCFILVRFTLELPQLGKMSGTGRKRLKRGIWVKPPPKKGGAKGTWLGLKKT